MNDFKTVEVDNLVFFNHYNNGDSFINREYIKDIIRHYPKSNMFYVHDKHPSLFQDLPVQQGPTQSLPPDVGEYMVIGYSPPGKTLFVNGWVGCHMGTGFLTPGRHANFPLLYRAWGAVFEKLGVPLRNWEDYHPEANYNVFDLTEADNYLNKIGDSPLVLICNGRAMSGQSAMGEMPKTLEMLARYFPDHQFLATYKVDVNLPNVTYTDDIFGSHEGNLHHIAYISKRAKVIVGKNSGPFTFSHIKENMNDPAKSFVCFGKHSIDSLMGDGEYLCNSVFSSTVDDAYAAILIKEYIQNPPYSNVKKITEVK